MPRIASLGSEDYLDGFDSLQALDATTIEADPRALSVPCPEVPTVSPRVLICHDNSGRRPASDNERRWSFEHWQFATEISFFSHRRVTVPPPAWTIAAHRQGAKSLGTICFEGELGAKEAVTLVTKSSTTAGASTLLRLRTDPRGNPFDSVGTHYIDKLIELALQKGFDGYLLNFEVNLGLRDEGMREGDEVKRRFAREHAAAVIAWVDTFRTEVEARIPQGSVVWYDSVTSQGDLRWQCRLTPMNLPFFVAAQNIFLDYHWRPEFLEDLPQLVRNIERHGHTVAVQRRHAPSQRSLTVRDVMVGMDVYGRGMPGGGGYDTSIALDFITRASKELSMAFFAPAWTRDELGGPRQEPWATWELEDDYFWRGGPLPPASVARERKRKDEEEAAMRREKGLPPRSEPMPPFRPVSDFVAHKSLAPSDAFYTSFAQSGSDNAFRIAGADAIAGPWTDAAISTASPGLLDPQRKDVCLSSAASYVGGHSVLVRGAEQSRKIALCAINVVARPSIELKSTLIWRDETINTAPSIYFETITNQGVSAPTIGLSEMAKVETKELENGWHRSTGRFSLSEAGSLVALGIVVPASASDVHIGFVAVQPATAAPPAFAEQPHLNANKSALMWRCDAPAAIWYAVESASSGFLGTTTHPSQFKLGKVSDWQKLRVAALAPDGQVIYSRWADV